MNLYEVTKEYGRGKGEETMWQTVAVVSSAVDADMSEEAKDRLVRNVYGMMSGGHYNEQYAHEDMAKLYYTDRDGRKHYGPYWTDADMMAVYEQVKSKIPNANCWDFAVALTIVKSDLCPRLKSWFPNATDDELTAKIVEATVDWINDEDNPFGKQKTWKYMNPTK